MSQKQLTLNSTRYASCASLRSLPKTGAQWRQLPHDFPKWQTVYTYFAISENH
ncbi:transposase [Companilactobacillus sp. HBUAS59544]|uniref:transposase n=1 Tax=Companilactobacillus sp. HBUAS59544 TaxID=3109363 RepID=UPI003FA5F443